MSRPTLTAGSNAPAQLLTERPAWKALAEHCQAIRRLHLRQLFADEPPLEHDGSTNSLIRRYRRLRDART